MLGSDEVTSYDLRFRLFDVPVRVNPWFWLVMLMISGQSQNLLGAVVFSVCAFVSVLAHEFGHGLSSRVLGVEPSEIVLYGMGGYCAYPTWHRSPLDRLIVLFCGPGAGFVLLWLVLLGCYLKAGLHPLDLLAMIGATEWPILGIHLGGNRQAAVEVLQSDVNRVAALAVYFLIRINFWWGVLNLIPIWPLDGGRIAEVVLNQARPRDGVRLAHMLSIATAGAIAFWFANNDDFLMALWFGYFGFLNYQVMQGVQRM